MSGSRTLSQLMSIAMLLLWSGVLLFFYYTGRLGSYMPPGALQTLVLAAGITLAILALFNLLTVSQQELEAPHSHTCCGGHHHDHSHQISAKSEQSEDAGLLHESSWSGRLIALAFLAVPITWAALKSPDRYSATAMMNKGVYENLTASNNGGKFSLRNDAPSKAVPEKAAAPAPTPAPAADTVKTEAKPAQAAVAAATVTPTPAATPANATSQAKTQEVAATTAPATPRPRNSPEANATPPPATIPQEVVEAKASTTSTTPTGADKAKSYGSFTLADLEAQVPRSKEGNFILDVPEIYYTAGDVEVQNVIKGQPIETVAQVLPEKVNNADGHRLRIFRLMVQCCAADARPYSVPVDFGKKAPEFKDMTWVKVTGKMSFLKEGDQIVPVIEGSTIEETVPPENAMISQ